MHKIVCAMESKNVRTIGAREVVKNNQNQKNALYWWHTLLNCLIYFNASLYEHECMIINSNTRKDVY